MVSYTPLWETMRKKGITTYALISKHKIQSKTIYNLKHNKNITTVTLEKLCEILECTPNEILEFKKWPSLFKCFQAKVIFYVLQFCNFFLCIFIQFQKFFQSFHIIFYFFQIVITLQIKKFSFITNCVFMISSCG